MMCVVGKVELAEVREKGDWNKVIGMVLDKGWHADGVVWGCGVEDAPSQGRGRATQWMKSRTGHHPCGFWDVPGILRRRFAQVFQDCAAGGRSQGKEQPQVIT